MTYPYAQRDLFADPERYEFAECSDIAFFENWLDYRQSIADKHARQNEFSSAGGKSVSDDSSLITLQELLLAFRNDTVPSALTEANPKTVIDSLTQKFEIFRRLFTAYDAGLRRDASAPEASWDQYVLFGHALADASDRYETSKFLSTMLKLNDALCSLAPEKFSAEGSASFVELIGREKEIVKRWEERAGNAPSS